MTSHDETRAPIEPGWSIIVGFIFVAAGIFAVFTSTIAMLGTSWPLAAYYLFGILGGISAISLGVRRLRTLRTPATDRPPRTSQ